MRARLSNIGLIIAIIVAGVSLPTAIISISKEPTINNYVENYYYNQTYYNQTYYNQIWYDETADPEPDYSAPLESSTHFNLTGNPE